MAVADQVQARVAADTVRVNKGAAAQTGDLQQYQNSGGTVLSRVDASGNFIGPGGSAPVDAAVIYMGALEGGQTQSRQDLDNASALYWMIVNP